MIYYIGIMISGLFVIITYSRNIAISNLPVLDYIAMLGDGRMVVSPWGFDIPTV